MSYTLTGTRYIGTGTLPTPVLGYDLIQTDTGNMFVCNSTATGWTQIGNVNQTNLGNLPLTGGNMTGAIAGVSGWAPIDSPNFTTSLKLNGLDVATQSNLATTKTDILNSISPKITEAVAATSASITVKSKIAKASGILTFTSAATQTIPLPTYPAPDGTTADESDCTWWVGLIGNGTTWTQGWPCGRSDSNGDTSLIYTANPTRTRTFAIYLQDKGGNIYPTTVAYMIIGVKS